MAMSFPLWSIHIQQWNNPNLDKSVDSVRIGIPLGPEMPIAGYYDGCARVQILDKSRRSITIFSA
jgi:hypothetical protein